MDSDKSNNIEIAAKDIQKEILDYPKTCTKWPPSIDELYTIEVRIPSKLEKLLINILSSKGKSTEQLSQLVQSNGQDLIYNTTRGTNRQLKHVQLGLNLKRKTGMDSKHFFHFINFCQVYEGLGKELQVSQEKMLVILNKSAKNALFSLRVPIKFTVKALEVELLHPL